MSNTFYETLTFLKDNKKSFKIIYFILFIGTILFIWKNEIFTLMKIEPVKNFDNSKITASIVIVSIYVGTLILSKVLAFLFKDDFNNMLAIYHTKKYIALIMPKIIKIVGETGAGKDTTAVGIITTLIKIFKKDIKELRKKLKRILYQIDTKKIEKAIFKDYERYVITSPIIFARQIMNFLTSNNFIKKSYRKYWKWEHLLSTFNESIVFKKYTYYKNYNDVHLVDLIVDYISLCIRVKIKNYVMSNQPLLENRKENIYSKIFSSNFFKLEHESKMKFGDMFIEKKYFPFVERMAIYETESDAWWNNVDANIRQYILKYGIRNFKAFIRHLLGESIYFIQVGQKAGRTNKLLRELDHAIIKINGTKVFDGFVKTRFLLGIIKSILGLSTYLFYFVRPLRNRLKHLYSKLLNKIDKLKSYGFIKVGITVANSEESGPSANAEIQTITDGKAIYGKYTTSMLFKTKNIRGLYDTHYLKVVANQLKEQSSHNILNVPNWENMEMTKKAATYINNPTLSKIMKISDDEILKAHYHKKDGVDDL